ncbi:hypothetical protein GQ54DRAFT_314683 [Martensiomyces pterosporus]|nr:hypothetical protein GQ54DRAFT_314683 [Martensiomyces pterosporus]
MNNEQPSKLARMVAEHLQRPLPEGSAQDDGGGDHTSSEVHSMDTDSTPLAMENTHSHYHAESPIRAFLHECDEQDNSCRKLESIYPLPNVGAFKPRSPGDILASQAQAKHIKYKGTLAGASHLRSVTALFTGGYSLISSSLPDNSDIMEEYLLLQRRTIGACLQEADKIERGVVENLLRQLEFPEHIRTQVNRKDTMEICDGGITNALQEYVNQKQFMTWLSGNSDGITRLSPTQDRSHVDCSGFPGMGNQER